MTWQPNEQLVRHMVSLLEDIYVPDNDRQAQIYQEFLLLQTRTDFALYLIYLTSGCPGSNISVSENARVAACSRLGRVFRDKDSTARQHLTDSDAIYIRNECIKYVPAPMPLIRRCVIDVLAYLAIYQELKGWEGIFSTLFSWISGTFQPGTSEYNNQQAGFETLKELFSHITAYDNLTDLFNADSWAPLFSQIFATVIDNLLSNNEIIRQISVQILSDCCPSKPLAIFNKSSPLLSKMLSNLYLLSINDEKNPKSRQLVMSLLSTLATMNINYVIGFELKGKSIQEIQIHAMNNPTPKITQALDFNTNMFALIDNFLILSSQFISRSHHTNCTNDLEPCDPVLDKVAIEAISFLISLLSSPQFELPNVLQFRTVLMTRHVPTLMPRLFQVCRYSGCDIIDAEAQHRQSLLDNQVTPHFDNGKSNNDDEGFDNEDDGIDYAQGDGDDAEEDENAPTNGTILRRAAVSAINAYIILARDETLNIFLSFIDGALSSPDFINRECALLLLGVFGREYTGELLERLSAFVPQLLRVLASPDQHFITRTIIAFTIGRLREIVIKLDQNGMRADDGRSIIQIFFSQALSMLSNSTDISEEHALLCAIESYQIYDEAFVYFIEFAKSFFELSIHTLCTTQRKQTVVNYTSFFSSLLQLFQDEIDVSIPKAFFLNQICAPFLQKVLTINYEDEALPDWLLALQQLIYLLPVEFLQSTSAPIYFRCLEILNAISPAMRESIQSQTTFDASYDSSLAWQLTNTTATTFDCLSSLIERLQSSFTPITTLPAPETIKPAIQECYSRIATLLYPELIASTPQQQQTVLVELQQHSSLPLLLDFLTNALNYDDSSTRQGAFSVIGELCSKIPNHPLLNRFFYTTLRICAKCITASPEQSELMSNAAWCFRMMIIAYGEQVFLYSLAGADGKQHFPAHLVLTKAFYISLTNTEFTRTNQVNAIIAISTAAKYAPQGFLRVVLASCDENVAKCGNICSQLFKSLNVFENKVPVQWNCLAELSNLLPLLASSPEMAGAILSFFGMLLDVIQVSHELASNGKYSPPQDLIAQIKANFGAIFSSQNAIWNAVFAKLDPNQQAVIKSVFQL